MRALTLLIVIALSGCTYLNPAKWHPYRIDIQQGNYITQDAVSQLKLGMSRAQVRFVLGTPLVTDMFHANRWDYKYQFYRDDKLVENKLLTVYFEGDRLVKVEGDAMPAEGRVAPALSPLASAPVASAPQGAVAP